MKQPGAPFRSLADTLTRNMIAIGSLCTVLVAGLQMGWVYRQQQAAFEAQIRLVTQTHMPLLASALWDIEPRQVQSLLDGIAAVPQVHYVLLDVATGQHFQSGQANVHAPEAHTPDVVLRVPSPTDPDQSLAELKVDFNEDYLHGQLAAAALQVALIAALLTLVLGMANNLMLRRQLLRPMRRIAQFAMALAPGRLTPQLQLDRPARGHRDEIDLVVEGFLTLQADTARYLDERARHEAQLAAQAGALESAVQQRTAQLEGVSHYLELLSRNSSRFLTVSLDEFPELMRNTLRELVQQLDGCCLAVAERLDAASPLLWRYVWQAPEQGLHGLQEGEEVGPGLAGSLSPGWNHLRLQDLSQAAPDCAAALQRHGARSLAWCAYQSGDSSRYLVSLSARPRAWTELSDRLTQVAADMVFNALRRRRDQLTMEQMHRELQHLSHTDPLTGLANRRRFDEVKLEETRRALRSGLPHDHVGLEVQQQRQRVDVGAADGRPVASTTRHLGMQEGGHVFEHAHAVAPAARRTARARPARRCGSRPCPAAAAAPARRAAPHAQHAAERPARIEVRRYQVDAPRAARIASM
jgi:HAMP domain-containing protein